MMTESNELIEAVLSWRNDWCDQEDLQEAKAGCNCEVCKLIRACDEYAERQNEEKYIL